MSFLNQENSLFIYVCLEAIANCGGLERMGFSFAKTEGRQRAQSLERESHQKK